MLLRAAQQGFSRGLLHVQGCKNNNDNEFRFIPRWPVNSVDPEALSEAGECAMAGGRRPKRPRTESAAAPEDREASTPDQHDESGTDDEASQPAAPLALPVQVGRPRTGAGAPPCPPLSIPTPFAAL